MTLKEQITEDMKTAMRAGEKERLATIRLALAAIKQREVDERIVLDDSQVLVGAREDDQAAPRSHHPVRKRRTRRPGRRENSEITVLQHYLPAQMSEAEVDALIAAAIAASGATSIKDMGKVMALVKPKAAGRTDMGAVSARIKQKLS